MKLLLLGVALGFVLSYAAPVRSADWLLLPATSFHAGARADGSAYNERNPGLGFEREFADTAVYAVTYRNSFDRQTVAVGGSWTPLRWGACRAGLTAALASGYPSPVLVVPTAGCRVGGYGLDAVFAPKVSNKTTAFVGIQFRVSLEAQQ